MKNIVKGTVKFLVIIIAFSLLAGVSYTYGYSLGKNVEWKIERE